MATVTGLTAERMLTIEGESVVTGTVQGDNLILTKHNGTPINAGNVRGPTGATGATGAPGAPGAPGSSTGAIPGEIRMWSSSVLPNITTYGKWVFADGSVQLKASSPIAAANIGNEWRTFGGASDPGALHFRVPDLRGLTPVGMDAMPGGSRANRMTRSVAIVLAGRSGEEVHTVTIAEMPYHGHNGGNHGHNVNDPGHSHGQVSVIGGAGENIGGGSDFGSGDWQDRTSHDATGITIDASGNIIAPEGGSVAHENVQPTVFIPYIVCLAG